MRIALIGTRGVPAHYGGFETCIEEVGRRLVSAGHEVVVYCRTPEPADRIPEYLGMKLVHLPSVASKALETLSHSGLSVLHAITHRKPDAAIVFNAANAPYLPLLQARGIPTATHVDGLEWKRTKWGRAGRAYYYQAEAIAVRFSDALIADARGIADYYTHRFGVPTRLIRYGAPIVERADQAGVSKLGLRPDGFHLLVARFEPENNLHLIVDGYTRSHAQMPLIAVGTAPYGDAYITRVKGMADERTRFLGGIWDQSLLDQLYANAFVYWHGHSVGGTNPSLLRALGASAPTIAHDNVFNREVLGNAGRYFGPNPRSTTALFEQAEADPGRNAEFRALSRSRADRYDWDAVATEYERLAGDLAAHRVHRPHLRAVERTATPQT